MVIGSQPDDRVIVFIFVNGFITNFLPIKKEWFVMECGVVIFRLEGVRSNFPVARIIRYLMGSV